jgi:hypothetical protein
MPSRAALFTSIMVASAAWSAGAAAADVPGQPRACRYDPRDVSACAPYACNPDVPNTTPVNQITAGTPGFCGKCSNDRFCGGAMCRPDGRCSTYDASPAPQPVWPRFHLLVTNAAFNFVDSTSPKPIVGVGYMFQGALSKTQPQKFDQRGFYTPDLPRAYFNLAASFAFAGPAQNTFLEAGVTLYVPSAPVAITTLSLGAEFQRQGASIWKVGNSTENDDRLGPSVSVGFLQNVFVRASYVFPLRGPNDHGALIVGVAYMKDLLGDLVPDRFQRFLPGNLK